MKEDCRFFLEKNVTALSRDTFFHKRLFLQPLDEAKTQSNGHLGMNYISMAMVYSVESGDTVEYNKWFKEYMVRWNELLPDIPLYSNIYYDVYNSNKLSSFETGPFWGAVEELIYQDLK